MKLYYTEQAKAWEEALPLGNGNIGAMVHGCVNREIINLNDDTLWSGFAQNKNREGAAEYYKQARDAALAGEYKKAQNIVEKHCLSSYTQGYLPIGDLLIDFDNENAPVSDYKRWLDISTAVAGTEYVSNGVKYSREYFVSAPGNCMAIRLSADKPGKISCKSTIECKLRYSTIYSDFSGLHLMGRAPADVRPSYHMGDVPVRQKLIPQGETIPKPGLLFFVEVEILCIGGRLDCHDGSVCISNANEVVYFIKTATAYDGSLTGDSRPDDLEAIALPEYFDEAKAEHIADYQSLYNRVSISFGENNRELPLPERLTLWETAENDPELFALLFQYGRYLMISGSRPGTVPLNLQGIWSPHVHPPWSSNYTLNINTEMNYWPAESANLSECHEPLLCLTELLRSTGAVTAKTHYDARGFCAHHNTDIWGQSNPVGESDVGASIYAFWPMAGGWLASHMYERFLYNTDEAYLYERAWPVIHDAARFFLDVLTPDKSGKLVFAPATSPENNFIFGEETCPTSKDSAMNTAIIRETLTNLVQAGAVLSHYKDFTVEYSGIIDEAVLALTRLPDYQIGKQGELLEWSEELTERDPKHRRTSHLYPLYPGWEFFSVSSETPAKLLEACKRTLDLRGEEATGWALAWRISLWARLHEGERAFAVLKKQLRPAVGGLGGCYPNLFGAHPPFQIDSNFGATAGITEMLLQSEWNPIENIPYIRLLPAIPKALNSGKVNGLKARGNIEVSFSFEKGELTKVELKSEKDYDICIILCNKKRWETPLKLGEIINLPV